MAERAAHLVDHVFPPVPVRQRTLSLPHRLRYLLAYDHAMCRTVVAVDVRGVLGYLGRPGSNPGGDASPNGSSDVNTLSRASGTRTE
jgi:hypothetical protein